MANIKSFVGGHDIVVYSGATIDPTVRKYKGGTPILRIPFSGQILNAKACQSVAAPVEIDGIAIPTKTPQTWESVDPIPEDCDYCVVSAMYVAACKALGMPTDKLLTIDGTVVSDDGRILGCVGFNRN